MLKVTKLTARHNELPVVFNASLEVLGSEIVALVGGNGAGKTSLAQCIVGLTKPHSGQVEIFHNNSNEDLVGKPTWAIARDGIIYVPETKPVFEQLSVEENLRIVFSAIRLNRRQRKELLTRNRDRFPLFFDRRSQLAGTLSGGQKRILAVSRALLFMDSLDMINPNRQDRFRLLILDEPTHGLHPKSVTVIREFLTQVNAKGVSILIIEQMVPFALGLAARGYLMRHGEIVASGDSRDLLTNPGLTELYLGATS